MSRHFLRSSLLFAALLASPLGVAGQFPDATSEQRAAGAQVVSIDLGTDRFVIRRDETITVQPRLLDANGNEVEGAVGFILAQGGVTPQMSGVAGAPIDLTGTQPGSGTFILLVMVPEDEAALGQQGLRQVGTLPIEVADWPAGSIELSRPEYAAYVGTSLRLGGRVMTEQGGEHSTAVITWRSSDPAVAAVTAGGILTGLQPGSVTVTAGTENNITARLDLQILENPVRSLTLSPSSTEARTGDVVEFEIVARNADGGVVSDAAVDLAVAGLDAGTGFVYDDGTFVAENPGAYRVIASIGGVSSAAIVEVVERAPVPAPERVAHGPRAHVSTSDLWVFEGVNGRDYAYTGTHAGGGGERMFVWDVTNPADIVLMDSVVVDARVVNDVKVSEDATWAIITREGASTRQNGIVVLDLQDPAHPTILSELTDDMTAGIHNVWIMGDVVFAVNDGTSAMNILDLSDPANPTHAGRWEIRPGETDKSLHDVWAEDGYAYLSYWDDGLVILDVGAGSHGGTAFEPAFVSSIAYPQGNTHVAWRDRDYVFLGDEIGTADGMRGYIHVIDVSDIDNPREVAKYEVPEAGAHNVWVDDGTLYIAYYQGGLRIVDVSGTLRGDLYRQGREIGLFRTGAPEGEAFVPNSPQAWGPQVYKGHVFVSDMYSGLWVIKHEKPRRVTF